jgi:hypothetical protein
MVQHLNYFATTTEINSTGDVILAASEKGVTVWDEYMLIVVCSV